MHTARFSGSSTPKHRPQAVIRKGIHITVAALYDVREDPEQLLRALQALLRTQQSGNFPRPLPAQGHHSEDSQLTRLQTRRNPLNRILSSGGEITQFLLKHQPKSRIH